MIPVLYPSNETSFATNGLGSLKDAVSCTVTEEKNGLYELEMEYPVSGIHYSDISEEKIVYATPSDGENPQPFEIYKITVPLGGIVTIYARHISHRLSFIPVKPFNSTGIEAALQGLKDNSLETNPFYLVSDIVNTNTKFNVLDPASLKECIGGGIEKTILKTFGGEIKWDKFQVNILANRGQNRGVRISYSKNLTDFNNTVDMDSCVTGVYPYWSRTTEGDARTRVTADIVYAENIGTRPYGRTIVLDCSQEFQDKPTPEKLQEHARKYLEKHSPQVSTNLSVSFAALWQTEEYKDVATLQRVKLCDTVTVEYLDIGINSTMKVIKTEYDVLSERYNKIELGEETKSTLDQTISNISSSVINEVSNVTSFMEESMDIQSKKINGGLGGYVVTVTDANGHPREIVIGDTDNKETMTHCLRINQNGIGFSDGYNSAIKYAWTIDGSFSTNYINGSAIKAGTLTADKLIAGESNKITMGVRQEMNAGFNEIAGFIRMVDGTIYIGNSTGTIQLVQTGDKVSFVDVASGTELAYIADDKFYTPEIKVTENLTLGDFIFQKYDNGDVNILWGGA